MSGNQQWVKNTNVPPESSLLWSIGEDWKISEKGKTYTKLAKIYKVRETHPDAASINALYNTLVDQLRGVVKEPVEQIGYYFVASTSADGTELVYVFEKTNLEGAKTQVKWAYNPNRQVSGEKPPDRTLAVGARTQELAKIPPPSLARQTITVPFAHRPIAWNDYPAIDEALDEGLIPLPVIHTGTDNWGFIGEVTGQRTFWWGRLKTVEIDSH